jgi:hypothetical protein
VTTWHTTGERVDEQLAYGQAIRRTTGDREVEVLRRFRPEFQRRPARENPLGSVIHGQPHSETVEDHSAA